MVFWLGVVTVRLLLVTLVFTFRLAAIYYLVDATRAGFTGFHESSLWLSLAVTALVAVAAFAAATALLARGWRLKP